MRGISRILDKWRRRRSSPATSLPERLYAHFPGAVMLLDAHGVILEVNPSMARVTGHADESLVGRRVTGLDEQPLRGPLSRALDHCVQQRQSWHGLLHCRHADGRRLYLDTLIQPLVEGPDAPLRLLCIQHDVGTLLEPAIADRERLGRLEAVVTGLPGVVFQLHQTPRGALSFGYLSEGLIALCGLTPDAVMASPARLLDRLVGEDRQALTNTLAQSSVSLEPWQLAFRIETPEGVRWLEATAGVRRESGGGTLWDGWLQDVTRRKEAERRTQHLISTDMLTGLLNRRAFLANGEALLAHATRNRRRVPVAMVDLDHFKALNDTHGHAAGDIALQRFATTCRDCLRPYDLIGRLGGEEFAVMLVDSEPEEAWGVLERLRQAVADSELALGGETLHFTVSMGVAFLDPGGNLGEALGRADHALYRAKRAGRNRIVGPETVI
ncbi:sensor domain-containing diguanylate cyclase [Halomonas stenophila]|uniref:diguanylate cyclase n=1 Tax=Halomonas stenophila TaxID=795312 RepID=A0A7W5EV58_9GAMM|nr:diguanylate cyclase [Halomonas stenophila]MBB3230915.1 diguanylate cyclase (GGDEF)-like protein/PAS domain S-box-containing protein [Halomonas stenophila]